MNYIKKWWLALCFISLTIILTTIIIIPHSTTSRNALSGLARDIMLNISAYTLDKSESYLRPAENAAELTRFLADSNIVSSDNYENMIKYFSEQLSLYRQLSGIYYGTIKGEFFMVSRSDDKIKNGLLSKTILFENGARKVTKIWSTADQKIMQRDLVPLDKYDPRKRPWFIEALMANDVIWTEPYIFFTSQEPGITTASPVYNKKGELQGVVGVDITIAELSTFLSTLSIGRNGKAFIVDTSGNVVAFPDLEALKQTSQNNKIRLSKINELSDPACRKAYKSLKLSPDQLPQKPVFTSFEHQGSRYNAVFTPFKNAHWPWIIGLYIPENDYLGEIKEDHRLSLVTAALAILLSGLIGWIVARKINAAKEEAIAANHAKSHFLAVMSHEIRTPMNVILGTTDLLKDSTPREDQKKYIKLLDNAGEGLLSLINDILDMSKVEAGLLDLESINFNPSKIMRQCCNVFEHSASNKGIELACRIDGKLPDLVEGDPVRVKQVLLNLIGNAVKFTDSGGVYVQAGHTILADGKVELQFEIQDTGPGIPENRQDAIFEHFTQADNSITREYQGTGLGLSISKKLCELMNGNITVSSSPGNGSTFIFTITLKEIPASAASEDNTDKLTENRTLPRKVLLIEDNKSNRLLFKHFISESPHTMKCASNGEEGIELYKEFQPDIIFMDIEMPVMDGYKATEEIRDWERIIGLSPVPIIALSAHAIKGTAESARNAGCSSYMTKPITKLQFLERIERKNYS
ncbi:hybrid sensor histidine kinase/response regulator [Desulfovibrio sp. JC022]|uniref:hybrid sensor histidine kinase/response regulator n=1 Tax=Desulfovibrio sp. JC022 TaxID=2593642 RepID=UPI0013D61387|nr:hybrid sensor histidine kinase/response regulator [Desulfovibrio sp. JC022]NDV22086.1 response regulator [Desulfovibrio sp. JC022]